MGVTCKCAQMPTQTYQQIYNLVSQIPHGRVATYGQIARLAGNPCLARVVGNALHANPDPENIHCHRVVNAKGEPSANFAFGGAAEQLRLLKAEGVEADGGRVDLGKYQWRPEVGSNLF